MARIVLHGFLLSIWMLVSPSKVYGAKDTTHYIPAVVLRIGGGYNVGLFDLGKRFTTFSTFPAGAYFQSAKNRSIGFEYNRFLGNRFVLDSLYGGITGPSNTVLDQNGNPAVIRYYMRGFSAQVFVGQSFKIAPRAKYARLQVTAGAGMLQHFIKMRFDKGILPQLEGAYMEGYDRLTNGIMLTQSVQYQYYNTQNISVFAGFNFVQSFTHNQRTMDYGTMRHEGILRKDFYIGLAAGILIPIPFKTAKYRDYYD